MYADSVSPAAAKEESRTDNDLHFLITSDRALLHNLAKHRLAESNRDSFYLTHAYVLCTPAAKWAQDSVARSAFCIKAWAPAAIVKRLSSSWVRFD